MEQLRQAIAQSVRSIFADENGRTTGVTPAPGGLFAADAVARRVHGDVACMMVGGVAALLLQMLHPAALAGVWDHSNFRRDRAGRLRRTARFIAATTYAGHDEALAAIARVRAIHERVEGVLPDGTRYRAGDPHLLAWVHVAEVLMFLAAYRRYGAALPMRDADRYIAEMAVVGRALGADPVPDSMATAQAVLRRFRPELRADARTREVAALILDQPPARAEQAPLQHLVMAAAIDLLPPWAQRLHARTLPVAGRPLLRAGTLGMARTIRWAIA